MSRPMADEESSHAASRRRGPCSAWRIAMAVAAVVGAAGIAWLAGASLRATNPAASTHSTPSSGDPPIAAPAHGAADGAADSSESSVTQRTPEMRSPAAAAPPAERRALVVTGRVLDERRRPVAAGDVTLLRVTATATHAHSDEAGRFLCSTPQLDAFGREAASLFALAADGRCTIARIDLECSRDDGAPPDEPIDAGELIVGPSGRLRVRVVDEHGPVASVALELACGDERRRAPPATSGSDGSAEWPALPPGPVRVRAFSADARSGVAIGELDAGRVLSLELHLAPTRAVDVQVADEEGHPIEGARVAVLESGALNHLQGGGHFAERWPVDLELPVATAPTDAAGRTRIAALPADVAGALRASKPGCEISGSNRYPSWRALPLAAEVTSVELGLRVPRPIELRWHVRAGAAPLPPEGSSIRIVPLRNAWSSDLAPPERGTIRDGDLLVTSVRIGERLNAWAIAPDGAIAEIEDPSFAGGSDTTSFAPGRRLTVALRDAHGDAVRGALITAIPVDRDQDRGWMRSSTRRTEADGVVRFFPLAPVRFDVYVARTSRSSPQIRLGGADLTHDDVAVEKWLSPPRMATLAFDIDGERRLPTRYTLRGPIIDGRARREDAARGEVQIELEDSGPAASAQLHVEADGFCPCDVAIPGSAGAAEPFVVVPLERGGTLIARILSTPSNPPRPHLQRLDAATGRFAPLRGPRDWIQFPNAGTDRYEFTALAPGRYRVADGVGLRDQLERSYLASDAVDVAAGATASVELDLRRVTSVRVTFTAPEGESPALARVVVVGSGDDVPQRSEQGVELPGIASNGSSPGVELRVDTTRALHVRAWHPWLVPARDGGEAVVDGTHATIALVLERAPLLTFAVPAGALPERPAAVTWMPADGGGGGGCAWAHPCDGRFRFGPPPVGRWDLLIDCLGFAPLWLRNVTLDGDARDLGELSFTRGSSLRIVAADPNVTLPPLIVRATTRDEPSCLRVAYTDRDGASPVVSGLPAGIVDVTVRDADTTELYASEALELDGVSTFEFALPKR